jgi:hypothetical protein
MSRYSILRTDRIRTHPSIMKTSASGTHPVLRFIGILSLWPVLYCSCYTSSRPMFDGSHEDGQGETIDGEPWEELGGEADGEEELACIDRDGDGYGEGPGCAGPDCNDNAVTCASDCSDQDGDGMSDCLHFCPANPQQVGYFEMRDSMAVHVRDTNLFLAAGYEGIIVLDIEDHRNPVEIGSMGSEEYFMDVDISGDHAFVAAREGGMRVIDISDLTTPYEEGHFDTFGGSVSVRGNMAYVAANIDGLLAIDVSDVRAPSLVGSFTGAEQTDDVFVEDDLAYVADYAYGEGLKIVDISHPSAMRQVGFFPIEGFTDEVTVREPYAFVAAGLGGLRILDVGDPEHISEVGFYIGSAYYNSVEVSGSYAFITAFDGLTVIDVSDVTRPSLAGFFGVGDGEALDVWYENGHAYVAVIGEGMYVISFECP